MKTDLSCIQCLVRNAVTLANLLTDDDALRLKIVRKMLAELSEFDVQLPPPLMARRMHAYATEITGKHDPYRTQKDDSTRIAGELLREFLEEGTLDTENFESLVRLAIAGNIIDFGVNCDLDLEDARKTIRLAFRKPIDLHALNEAENAFERAENILYLLDNCGEAVFDACIDSVIELTCTAGGNCYAGSGFAVGNRGYAVTNTHVVTENGRPIHDIKAYVCGKTVPAEIVVLGDDRGGSGSGEDLALIRLKNPPSRMKGVTFAEGELRNGQKLYVIGNALGMGTCITSGIISDKRRMVNGKPRFMTDGAANHGNSGGPVFDEAGEVIGAIVAGIDNAKGMNFAIPADIILDFLEKCKSIAKDLRV